MTEKEMFLNTWKQEHETLMKVLKAFPEDKLDMKIAEKLRTPKELSWVFVTEQGILNGALDGNIDFSNLPRIPATYEEILSTLEANHKKLMAKVKKLKPKQWNQKVMWMAGPGKTKKIRAADVAWFTLMDRVHHRGQFSVFLRLAGAKVPSIYGPSADDPWM